MRTDFIERLTLPETATPVACLRATVPRQRSMPSSMPSQSPRLLEIRFRSSCRPHRPVVIHLSRTYGADTSTGYGARVRWTSGGCRAVAGNDHETIMYGRDRSGGIHHPYDGHLDLAAMAVVIVPEPWCQMVSRSWHRAFSTPVYTVAKDGRPEEQERSGLAARRRDRQHHSKDRTKTVAGRSSNGLSGDQPGRSDGARGRAKPLTSS